MGNTESFEVEEREPSKLQSGEIIKREGPFSLYALKYTRSLWYEAVLNEDVFSPKHFSLFRLKDRTTAEHQFSKVCTQLMPYCQGSQECYNKKTLKRLLRCLEEQRGWSPAHVAVSAGISSCLNREEFKEHLDSALNESGQTPLLLACSLAEVQCVRVLLQLGVDVGAVDGSEEGRNAIHVASEKSPECLEALLVSELVVERYGYGLSHLVNYQTKLLETSLHIACRYQQATSIQLLLMHGADPEVANKQGFFPIHLASQVGCADCVNVLCQFNTQQSMLKDAIHGNTPLHCASLPGCIHMLVNKHQANTEVKNAEGLTPLHFSIVENRLKSVIALLYVGANPDTKAGKGDSPLHLAVKVGSVSLVHALIVFGADVHSANAESLLPLHMARTLASDVNDKQCNNLQKSQVVEALEGVHHLDWECLAQECRSSVSQSQVKRGDTVLCLDGGGVRGLILVQLLLSLEKITQKSVVDLFDWIGGTSTGGLLALALVHAKSNLRQCQSIYFSMKDVVFKGERPFASKPLEDFFKETFGEQTTMDSVMHPRLHLGRVLVTTTIADRLPARLYLFRNYGDLQEEGEPPPSRQLVWKAARATGAAPTYFNTMGRFIDGGLVSNNPTLDVLSEIQMHHNRSVSGPMPRLSAVVSLGTGCQPEVPVHSVNVFRPVSIAQAAHVVMGGASLATLLLNQVTQASGRPVERSRSWCMTMDTPFYRFSPLLQQEVDLAETRDDVLVRMLWQTQVYVCQQRDKIKELAIRLCNRNVHNETIE